MPIRLARHQRHQFTACIHELGDVFLNPGCGCDHLQITQLFIQGSGLQIDFPSQLLSSLPYWATIVVLVAISRNAGTIRLNSPVSLGKPYRPDA